MASSAIKSVIEGIDDLEEAAEAAPEPIGDVIPLMIPVPTYKALSDAAAKKNMTVAEVLSRAISAILREV